MNQEVSSTESIIKKLRQEQFNAMERGFKLEERKILFILALFGLGGYNLGYGSSTNNLKDFSYLYYLIPLLAIAFDALISRQSFFIHRIGVFLLKHSTDPLEREWEAFVHNKRWFRPRIDIFTMLAFGASLWLIFKYVHGENFSGIKTFEYSEYIWFGLLLGVAVYNKIRLIKRRKKLES